MRVLCHAQHFKGIGHFVRMHAIASGMSEAHEVYLVDGGRPVPRRPGPIELIPLPRLVRVEGRIVGLGTDAPVASLVEQRIRLLTQAVERIRPDAILVDIYPFSKWEVEEEITRMIAVARRLNARVRVVTSLRDIVPMTLHEVARPGLYEAGVLSRLASFDAILAHGDPSFARIEDYFDRAADVPIPVHYTGFVAGTPTPLAGTPGTGLLRGAELWRQYGEPRVPAEFDRGLPGPPGSRRARRDVAVRVPEPRCQRRRRRGALGRDMRRALPALRVLARLRRLARGQRAVDQPMRVQHGGPAPPGARALRPGPEPQTIPTSRRGRGAWRSSDWPR